MNGVRKFLLDNIETMVGAFDAHDAGIQDDGRYRCHCGWIGAANVWLIHLAEAMADAVNERVVQLPLVEVPA